VAHRYPPPLRRKQDNDDHHHCEQQHRPDEKLTSETGSTVPLSVINEVKNAIFAASEVIKPEKL